MTEKQEYTYLSLPIEFMPYGKERRAVIMRHFESTPNAAYVVNRRYRPQLKDDPDLQKLIRTGKLKRIRKGNWNNRCRSTILVKS